MPADLCITHFHYCLLHKTPSFEAMNTVTLCCSTPSSNPLPASPPYPSPPPQLKLAAISRRDAALSLSAGAIFPLLWLTTASPSFAFDFRISGPKDWLKEQKKKSVKYILAPIVASREILSYAQKLLLDKDSGIEQKDMDEIRAMLNSSARDCVVEDRSSVVAFQARTGVEVCTFKLLVSNASSLLDDDDPTKLEAEARLNDLIRSFTFLNGLTKEDDVQLVSNRQKVADALTDTLSSLDKFEQGIMGCIGV